MSRKAIREDSTSCCGSESAKAGRTYIATAAAAGRAKNTRRDRVVMSDLLDKSGRPRTTEVTPERMRDRDQYQIRTPSTVHNSTGRSTRGQLPAHRKCRREFSAL